MPARTTFQLELVSDCASPDEPRLGGGALIGGVARWPHSPNGASRVLLASLPADFVANKLGIDIGDGRIASVVKTYANGEYFFNLIRYHGDAPELALLRHRTARVLVHERGESIDLSERNKRLCGGLGNTCCTFPAAPQRQRPR